MTRFLPCFKKPLLVLILLTASVVVKAQEYVYVNTSNLLLRDRPEPKYNVYNVLQAPCKLKVIPYSTGYDSKAIKERFYHVKLFVHNEQAKRSYSSYGWVEKKYVVMSMAKVTAHYADSTNVSYMDIPVSGELNKLNYRSYPFPKYKGGEKNFGAEYKRKYQKGPRGGCYYINEKGRKVYVGADMCK